MKRKLGAFSPIRQDTIRVIIQGSFPKNRVVLEGNFSLTLSRITKSIVVAMAEVVVKDSDESLRYRRTKGIPLVEGLPKPPHKILDAPIKTNPED